MEDLPVQIAEVHFIVIYQTQRADSRRRKVRGSRRAQSSGPGNNNPRPLELLLSLFAESPQHYLATVSLPFLIAQHYGQLPSSFFTRQILPPLLGDSSQYGSH